MYAFIRGQIQSIGPDGLILENNGIGYRIYASAGLLARFPQRGESCTVYTYLYMREDVMALYGFPSEEDVRLFEQLLTVSGIGPKVASGIIGAMAPSHFAMAVLNGDVRALTDVRGIGKKTAERLILELKDKLRSEATAAGRPLPSTDSGTSDDSVSGEAISALIVLGYGGREASEAVARVAGQSDQLESVIKLALRQLMR